MGDLQRGDTPNDNDDGPAVDDYFYRPRDDNDGPPNYIDDQYDNDILNPADYGDDIAAWVDDDPAFRDDIEFADDYDEYYGAAETHDNDDYRRAVG